jgi:hypothetical protein
VFEVCVVLVLRVQLMLLLLEVLVVCVVLVMRVWLLMLLDVLVVYV